MSEVDAHIRCIRISLFEFVGRLNAPALITDARQPRACRAALDVTLRKGGWKGEAAVIEGVIAHHVQYFHLQVFIQQVLLTSVTFDVASQ